MNEMKTHFSLFSVVVVMLLSGPAFASVQISGLFNTGVDGSSAVLADMAVDPHYSITSSTATAYSPDDAYTYADLSSLYSVYPGSWVNNTSTSQWIGPASDIVGPFDPDWAGDYNYDLVFDLTGLDPNTAADFWRVVE